MSGVSGNILQPTALLDIIKPVDGSGSGLDADMIDGFSSADFTKLANLLNEIKAVDGSGSGLDADMLDGLSGSDLLIKKYISPEQTITSSGALTLAHDLMFDGLNVMPSFVQFYLICKTAQRGYAIADRLGPFGSLGNGTTTNVRGIAIVADDTSIKTRYSNQSNVFEVMDFGTGSFTGPLTNSNWKVEFQAFYLP